MRSACWRLLQPETLAGLADRSSEGTEERWALSNAVHAALPQRGQPSKVLGHRQQNMVLVISVICYHADIFSISFCDKFDFS